MKGGNGNLSRGRRRRSEGKKDENYFAPVWWKLKTDFWMNSSSSSTWNRKNLPEPFSEVFGSLSRKVPSSSCGFNLESHYCYHWDYWEEECHSNRGSRCASSSVCWLRKLWSNIHLRRKVFAHRRDVLIWDFLPSEARHSGQKIWYLPLDKTKSQELLWKCLTFILSPL